MSGGVRDRLAADLESKYSQVVATLEEAMTATRKSWAYCPGCKRKVQVDQPDTNARIKAVELWLTEGFGRPGTGSSQPSTGAVTSLEELKKLSMAELAAVAWAYETPEERDAHRRLLDGVREVAWPPGFDEALVKLDELAREYEAAKA